MLLMRHYGSLSMAVRLKVDSNAMTPRPNCSDIEKRYPACRLSALPNSGKRPHQQQLIGSPSHLISYYAADMTMYRHRREEGVSLK